MSYQTTIEANATNAEHVELLFRDARNAGEIAAFQAAIDASYHQSPDNLLFAAWHYRLLFAAKESAGRAIAWLPAFLLALLNGAILWWLSDPELTLRLKGYSEVPYFVLLWAPITASLVMLFFAVVRKTGWLRVLLLAGISCVLALYVRLLYEHITLPAFQEQYLTLMALHLPLLAWLLVGVDLLWATPATEDRFAFLLKSFELFVVGGLFAIALGLLTAITFGLFEALGVTPPETVQRLFWAGGGGVIPLLAVALIYAPERAPKNQSFDEGLSRLIAALMRVLVAPTLLILIVYLAFIPGNFFEPFENRDVLIVFNAMLFAVVALLLGATPIHRSGLAPSTATWLRRGLMAVALLAILVGVYALAAIGYRTVIDRLTPNRLAFIGWNVVNIGLLLWLLLKQLRADQANWVAGMHKVFGAGLAVYGLWGLVVILSIPWLFTVDLREVERLPDEVQRYVLEQPAPILLKCTGSPHVYALEDGEKRWIKDIPTFEQRGYRWSDVNFVSCIALREVPDGPAIPPDAGPPPQP